MTPAGHAVFSRRSGAAIWWPAFSARARRSAAARDTSAFHQTVRDDHDQVAATIARLRENTRGGDFAYYSDIAACMAGLPLEGPSPARWVDGEQAVRDRWRALVLQRRAHLTSGGRS